LFELLALDNTFHNYSNDLNQIRKFIELCIGQGKLKNWTIAIKASGNARNVQSLHRDFPFSFRMTLRRGPDKNSTYRIKLLRERVFAVSGKSSNIVSPDDLSVLLPEKEKAAAEKDFIGEKIDLLVKKKGLSPADAKAQVTATRISYPGRIYREKMSDENGLLLIYLQDLKYIFEKEDPGSEDLPMSAMARGFDLNIPLIAYAFAFPPIVPDPGGEYVISKYWSEEEEEADEFDNELASEEL
ncbi:MAG TPA: hypothetical protein VN824_09390, partial [Puia sp.]|nr:hypothetical protein [Puia sp.]